MEFHRGNSSCLGIIVSTLSTPYITLQDDKTITFLNGKCRPEFTLVIRRSCKLFIANKASFLVVLYCLQFKQWVKVELMSCQVWCNSDRYTYWSLHWSRNSVLSFVCGKIDQCYTFRYLNRPKLLFGTCESINVNEVDISLCNLTNPSSESTNRILTVQDNSIPPPTPTSYLRSDNEMARLLFATF